jgi:Rhodopirellula transposase DDE domain
VRHPLPPSRSRGAGGGRKRATVTDPTLLRDLDALVEPTAPGDPASPLRWTSRSVRTLAVALDGLGHHVSHTVVAELLHALGYSLQANVKTREGRQHPDRDAQFRYIAEAVRRGQRRRQPTISVDTNYDPSRIMDIARGPIRVHALVIERQRHALILSVYT